MDVAFGYLNIYVTVFGNREITSSIHSILEQIYSGNVIGKREVEELFETVELNKIIKSIYVKSHGDRFLSVDVPCDEVGMLLVMR